MLRSITIVLSITIGGVAFGQQTSVEISEAQISDYQRGMDAGCKGLAGPRRVAPERVKLCDCLMKSLQASMSREEWQQATLFAHKRDEREMKVLEPHVAVARLCRNAL
jgi:hypothetical protein